MTAEKNRVYVFLGEEPEEPIECHERKRIIKEKVAKVRSVMRD